MEFSDIESDLSEILLTEEQIHEKLAELARRIETDYADDKPLLVGVLRGAVMVMADLARELKIPIEMDWMAVSSYGSGTQSSGVVRILKDLDTDLHNRHVLIVEDIIDSGLTLTGCSRTSRSRGALGRDLRPAAQAGGGQCRGRREVHRLRDPQRLRCRLRLGLRRALPKPPRCRGARSARLRVVHRWSACPTMMPALTTGPLVELSKTMSR